ncbi:MAG: TolC family outer membrane protein [Alphaproteobacteria bacterium]
MASLAACAVLCALGAPAPARAQAFTLDDAIITTLRENPDMKSAREERNAVEQELIQALGFWHPWVDLDAATGTEWSNNPTTRGREGRDVGESGTLNMRRYESNLVVTQLLFDGFAADHEIQRNRHRLEAAARQITETAELLTLRVVEVYYAVLRERVLLEITRENVRSHESLRAAADQRFRGGSGSKVELAEASARLSKARSEETEAVRRLLDANANYLRAVGRLPDVLLEPEVPDFALPRDVDEITDRVVTEHPSVRVVSSETDAIGEAVEVVKGPLYPRVNLELAGGYNKNLDGTRGYNNDVRAMLRMRYNLYRGGADIGRVRELEHRLVRAREEIDVMRREVAEDARETWNKYVLGRERTRELLEELNHHTEIWELYWQQFDLGTRSLLDLLDAEQDLFNNRTDLVTQQVDRDVSVFRLLALQNMLLPTMGLTPNP